MELNLVCLKSTGILSVGGVAHPSDPSFILSSYSPHSMKIIIVLCHKFYKVKL